MHPLTARWKPEFHAVIDGGGMCLMYVLFSKFDFRICELVSLKSKTAFYMRRMMALKTKLPLFFCNIGILKTMVAFLDGRIVALNSKIWFFWCGMCFLKTKL